jgi:Mn-dependent DtxR family transcriptional regulator
MKVAPYSVGGLEQDYLRTVYELADRKAKRAVSFMEVRAESGQSEDEADSACDFWADRGILEWTALGHIALTHVGLRRAERLERRGWTFTPF